MTSTLHAKTVVRLAAVATLALAPPTSLLAAAGPEPAPAGRERVAITLRALGTDRADDHDGATESRGSAGGAVGVGESGRAYVAFGRWADGRVLLCMGGTGGGSGRDLAGEYAHVFSAGYTVLPSPMGEVAVELTWEHLVSDASGEVRRAAGDTRRIEMREGERHVLGFVEEPAHEGSCYRNVVVVVDAAIREDPALASEQIAYDLWLRHTDDEGGVSSRHVDLVGLQGERVSYRFTSLRFPVEGERLADGTRVEAVMDVSGTIRGRLRPDGSVDLELSASRWLGVSPAGRPRQGGVGDGGRKIFRVRPGETVGMTLPEPRGGHRILRDDRRAGRGPVDDSDSVGVRNPEFYAGHATELILTVRDPD